MNPVAQSQPPIPRQPIGVTFVVAISVLGFFLFIQFCAVAAFFLPKLRQQVVESATVERVAPAAESATAPMASTNAAPTVPQPDPVLVQRISSLVADSDKAYRIGDSESALRGLEEADALLPNDPGILLRKARALETLQQPGDASSVYAQVLAIPGLPPDLRMQASRKIEQLGGSAASTPAPATTNDTAAAADIRDEIGLQPGSNLGIVDARLRDGSPGMKALRVAIKSRPAVEIDTREMKLHVFFYESDEAGDVQLTDSKVVSEWISPPVNWADNEPEVLDVNYILPDSNLEGSAASNGSPGRTFVGYIVGVYYNSELQDTRAEPGTLAKRFPLPLYLKQETP